MIGRDDDEENKTTELAAGIDDAIRHLTRTGAEQRVEAAELGAVQFTDEDIKREQGNSMMVNTLKERGLTVDSVWLSTTIELYGWN